jgi:hypothetical protein
MLYTYRYPGSPGTEQKARYEQLYIQEDYLDHTHTELMNRLDDPSNTLGVSTEIDAPLDVVWEEAAGSAGVFFSHHPGYLCLIHLNSLGSQEGGRYVVVREHNGGTLDRIGEVLVNMPESQLTVSDIDSADPSVAGSFPALYTVRAMPHPEDAQKTLLFIGYTMLGVPFAGSLSMLIYIANSITEKVQRRLGRV